MEMPRAAIMVHGEQSMSVCDFTNPLKFIFTVPQNNEITARYDVSQPFHKKFQVVCFDILLSLSTQPGIGLQSAANDSLPRMVALHGSSRGATDPRDRIYAFRSLSADVDASDDDVFPDYKASVEEVYGRFARWCLVKKKDLAYLGFAGLPDSKVGPPIGNFPSWVADWTPGFRVGTPDALRWADPAFQAGAAFEPTTLWEPSHPRLLRIKGRVVDAIAEQAVARADLLTCHSINIQVPNAKPKDILRAIDTYQQWMQLSTPDLYHLPYYPPGKELVKYIQEGQLTFFKYGSLKGPRHMWVDVAWMESCKAIAKLDTSPDRFDAFWQAMTRYQAARSEDVQLSDLKARLNLILLL